MTKQELRNIIREEVLRVLDDFDISDVTITEQTLIEQLLVEAALFTNPQELIDKIVPLLIKSASPVLQTINFSDSNARSDLMSKALKIQMSNPQWEVFAGSKNDPETWIVQDTIAGNTMKSVVGSSEFSWVPFSKGHKTSDKYAQTVAVKTERRDGKNTSINKALVDTQGRLIAHPDFRIAFPEMQTDWSHIFEGLVGIAAAKVQGNVEVEKKLTSYFLKTFTFDSGILGKLAQKVKDAVSKAIPATQPTEPSQPAFA